MAAVLTWNGDKFNQQLAKATAVGLLRATVFYHAQCQRAVSRPNTGVRVRTRKGKSTRTVYPNPSKPGEPPRLRTGWGRSHVVREFDKSVPAGRVGVSQAAIYMFYLEIGTRKVKRRPWLLATLMKYQETIGKLAAIGGKGEISA